MPITGGARNTPYDDGIFQLVVNVNYIRWLWDLELDRSYKADYGWHENGRRKRSSLKNFEREAIPSLFFIPMKTENEKYCQECGEAINVKAELCPKCGVRQPGQGLSTEEKEDQNKWLITLLLCWFLGVLGVHRFYTGHTMIGVLQLITLGGCGIWTIIDLIIIVMGNYKDADGNPIKNK